MNSPWYQDINSVSTLMLVRHGERSDFSNVSEQRGMASYIEVL